MRLKPEFFLGSLANEQNLSFLFVDDGSTDDTLNIINGVIALYPTQCEVLSLEDNLGKAEAVRRGIMASLAGSFDNIGYWDADLATPLDAIRDFCRILDSTDLEMVIGARVRLLGRVIERRALRHYLGRVFATCVSVLILRISIYDSQCGAKIFKNSNMLKNVFGKPFLVKWVFDVEMFARFLLFSGSSPVQISTRWIEYPLVEWSDVKGSKLKGKKFIWAAFEVFVLIFYLCTPARRGYKKYLLG
ncbi:MAG: glycosyltransferase [Proteobacteria bacterium]|nr:glycosyltransferase [Pseudomonadota bacterium]MBU1715996.1 glycosyltransferase [Pseudomonadota bacterium]